jgi:hypothetical protein
MTGTGLFARDGSEFVGNTTTAGDQNTPIVAALATGGFVMAWNDAGSGHGVVAQLFDSTGHKLGGEVVLGAATASGATLTALSTGGFALGWYDSANSAAPDRLQLFDSAGAKVGAEIGTSLGTIGNHFIISTAALSGGGFVMVSDFDGAAQIFDSAGNKVGGVISQDNVTFFAWARVAGLSDGSFVMAGTTLDHDLLLQRFSASGEKIGSQIVAAHDYVTSLSISSQPDGGFALAWEGTGSGVIYARAFGNDGTPTSPVFIETRPGELTLTQPNILGVGGGQYLLSWTGSTQFSATSGNVRGQIFDSAGNKVGSDFLISQQNDIPSPDHGYSDAALLASGEVITVWQGSGPGDPRTQGGSPSNPDHGIRGQIFAPITTAALDIVPSGTSFSEVAIQNLPALVLSTTSAAVNATYTYQLVADSTGGGFAIAGDKLLIANSGLLDADNGEPTSVTIQVTDNAGNVTQEVIALTLNDDAAERRYSAGPESNVVNGNSSDIDPSIAKLPNGGSVITWTDTNYSGDGTGYAIHAQIYDGAGAKVGSQFLVNTLTNAIQAESSVTTLSSGNFVVTWSTDATSDISAQIFSASGAKIGGEFTVNSTIVGTQYLSEVAALANGGFAVTWIDPSMTGADTSGSAIRMQVFDATGAKVGAEQLVNTSTTGNQDALSIAGLADGSFVETWTDASGLGGDNNSTSIKGQRFDATGQKIGGEFLVNTQITGAQKSSTVSSLGDGFVVAWADRSLLKAQAYDSAGHAIGGEMTIASGSVSSFYAPAIGELPGGGYVVSWSSTAVSAADSSGGAIMAQIMDSAGQKVGDAFVVNAVTTGAQIQPDLVVQPDGTFSIVWLDAQDNGQHAIPEVRTFSPTQPGIFGTDHADTLAGVAAGHENFIYGQGGDDTLVGGDSHDALYGGSGVDALIGGGGNDFLDGGTGADHLYGGIGNDTYYADQAGDLVFENAGEGTDTVVSTAGYYLYANVENLTLAGGAGDIFGVGNELANTITGNEGSNLLIAGAGDDIVHAGAGVDSLFGQDGNDHLFGDAGVDYLVGGTGDDVLDGGTGADALYGEDGNDTLYGGTDFQTDILVGGNGNDVLHGDSGLGDYDLMDGGAGDDSYYVDTPADLTFEAMNGGTDTVYANIIGAGYYLYANVENLVLLGTTPYGVGNELDNHLTGNDVGNYLLGGAGNDLLNGKGGNDVLFGEAGADTFVFEHGTGGDVIGDFTAGTDKIDLSAFGFAGFAQVQSAMVENGGTTAINLGGGDFIVINGVAEASLHAGDFILGGGSSALLPAVSSIGHASGLSDLERGNHTSVPTFLHAGDLLF